jgi:ABC-type polysaccharide/polyol phosphate export permease
VPYAVFTPAALLPWTYFSYVLMQSGESLVGNANMISKVYFPRLVLPVSAALAGLVDFGIAFIVLTSRRRFSLQRMVSDYIDWNHEILQDRGAL